MDALTEKSCFEEIDHILSDEDRKVTISEISNNWNVSLSKSESLLLKWTEKYKGKREIERKHLIRGIDANGNCIISVVPDGKLKDIEKTLSKISTQLFSVELTNGNSPRIDIPIRTAENAFVSLSLETAVRDRKEVLVPPTIESEVTKEAVEMKPQPKKASNSLFGSSTKTVVKEKPKIAETTNAIKEEPKSPAKKSEPSKAQKTKNAKSISSFFSAKQAQTKNETEVCNAEVKMECEETPNPNCKKRQHDDSENMSAEEETSQNLPPQKKKVKMEPISVKSEKKNGQNKSRIMRLVDSSSDEDDEPMVAESDVEHPTNGISADKENPESETVSKIDKDLNENAVTLKRRRKVKKMVTKTYKDDEGFINTVRVVEEVSCSEEEPEEVPPKVATTKKEAEIKKEKKKVSPPTSKKQGSILSFFAKK